MPNSPASETIEYRIRTNERKLSGWGGEFFISNIEIVNKTDTKCIEMVQNDIINHISTTAAS